MVIIDLMKVDTEKRIAFYRCMPEGDEEESFEICVDPINKKIISNSLGFVNSYVSHAAHKIYDVYSEKGGVPNRAISVWC